MQNDFERQVQQKMEELKFSPSQPVWQNIEVAIRKKRERRRMLLWLPLFFLALGGSIFLLYPAKTSTTLSGSIRITSKSDRASSPRQSKETKDNDKKSDQPVTASAVIVKEDNNNQYVFSTPEPITTSNKKATEARLAVKESKRQRFKKEPDSNPHTNMLQKTSDPYNSSSITKTEARMNESNRNELTPVAGTNPDSAVTHNSPTLTKTEKPDSKPDEVANPVVKLKQDHKWRLGLTVVGGFSALNNHPITGTTAAQSLGSVGATASPPASPISPDRSISYSASLLARKFLGDRLSLSAGVSYQYYSTKIRTGQIVKRDTVLTSGYGYSPTLVSGYYPPVSSTSTTATQDYNNQFHFISIPISLDYQLFRNLPLYLQAGFSIQRLISTNSLINSYDNRTLYRNDDAFSKTLLFTEASVNYQVLKGSKISIMAGPKFQYGLSSSYSDGSNKKHLYSAGLQASIWFGKSK